MIIVLWASQEPVDPCADYRRWISEPVLATLKMRQ
jgi:hypothetical protein